MIRIGALVSDKKKPIIAIISIFWHPCEKAINNVCVCVCISDRISSMHRHGRELSLSTLIHIRVKSACSEAMSGINAMCSIPETGLRH